MADCHLAVLFASPLVQKVQATDTVCPIYALDVEQERKSIHDALVETNRAVNYSFSVATSNTLVKTLSGSCRVLHFCAHGTENALLLESDEDWGMAHFLTTDNIANLLDGVSPERLQCVVISACHSRKIGAAFISARVPHVVCVEQSQKVQDKTANKFAEHFYSHLFSGHCVPCSFRKAYTALKIRDHASEEADKFVLLPEVSRASAEKRPCSSDCVAHPPHKRFCLGGDLSPKTEYLNASELSPGNSNYTLVPPKSPDSIAFSPLQLSSPTPSVSASPACSTECMPSNPQMVIPSGQCTNISVTSNQVLSSVPSNSIIGRHQSLHSLLAMIRERRVVSVHGLLGIGKHTLTQAAAAFLRARPNLSGGFRDGVIEVSLEKCETMSMIFSSFMQSLEDALGISIEVKPKDSSSFERPICSALQNKRVLILLQRCDDAFRTQGVELRSLVSKLLHRIPDLKILISSRSSVDFTNVPPGICSFFKVDPLDPVNACEMFKCLARQRFGNRRDTDIEQLTKDHPVMVFLGNHPQAILLCVNLLHSLSFSQISQLVQNKGVFALTDKSNMFDQNTMHSSMFRSLDLFMGHLNRSPGVMILFALLGTMPAGIFQPSEFYKRELLKPSKFPQCKNANKPPFDLDELFKIICQPTSQLRKLVPAPASSSGAVALNEYFDDDEFVAVSWQDCLRQLQMQAMVYTLESATKDLFAVHRCLPFITDFAKNHLIHRVPELYTKFIPALGEFVSSLCQWLFTHLHSDISKYARSVLQLQEQNILEFLRLVSNAQLPNPVNDKGLQRCIRDVTRLFPQILCRQSFRISDAVDAARLGLIACQLQADQEGEIRALLEVGSTLNRFGSRDDAMHELLAAETKIRKLQSDGLINQLEDPKIVSKVLLKIGTVLSGQQKFDEAIAKLKESETICTELNDQQGIILMKRHIASVHWNRNNLELAIKQFQEIQQFCHNSVDFVKYEADALRDLGKLYIRMYQYDKAGEFFAQCLELRKSLDDREGIAFTTLKLGDIAIRTEHWQQAERSLNTALQLFRELEQLQGQANCLFSLGWAKQQNGQYDSALVPFQDAVELFARIKDETSSNKAKLSKAECKRELAMLNDYPQVRSQFLDEAFALAHEVLSNFDKLKYVHGRVLALLELSLIEWMRQKRMSAQDFATRALQLADSNRDFERMAESNLILSKIHASQNRPVEATKCLEEANRVFPCSGEKEKPRAELEDKITRVWASQDRLTRQSSSFLTTTESKLDPSAAIGVPSVEEMFNC
eukprot:c9572_g1_i2.p1 GENE.c9572_g1_i2~~c9572_g1_i2.p1  ORF type:complete len:1266 (-),score=219.43 c9572_g1_i2:277-4074(-)